MAPEWPPRHTWETNNRLYLEQRVRECRLDSAGEGQSSVPGVKPATSSYRVCHLKCNPTTTAHCVQKWNRKSVHPNVSLQNSAMILYSKSSWLLGRRCRQVRKICANANMVHSWAERVFTLQHYLESKSFADVCETFSNAYRDNETPNTRTVQRLLTTCREAFVCDTCSTSDRTAEITAVPISNSASAANGRGCKNSVRPFVPSFSACGCICILIGTPDI
jgi:hypothetical protein